MSDSHDRRDLEDDPEEPVGPGGTGGTGGESHGEDLGMDLEHDAEGDAGPATARMAACRDRLHSPAGPGPGHPVAKATPGARLQLHRGR
jgi:hypothetical protein